MQAAEAIVRILEKEGITAAFGIPGAGINPVYKYLKDSSITHHTMRHEEAAVHAADGYCRATGDMALAICTSGPGATNFVTGLYTAQIDSIPMIAITGQNVSALLGKDAFQCVDMVSIAAPVSKRAWCVTQAEDIPSVMREACHTARSGKPGPVVIDLPLDIQKTEIDFDPASYQTLTIRNSSPDPDSIKEAIRMIDEAERPAIIMGGGVVLSRAEKDFIEFAEYMNLPVITTYMAKGAIPENHPLHVQHVGIQVGAYSIGNSYFLDSDLIVGVGCRFTDRHTGDVSVYQGDRRFIHINIEPREIGKIIKTDLGIVSDAGLALRALLEEAKRSARRAGAERVKQIPSDREAAQVRPGLAVDGILHPKTVFDALNRSFDDDTFWTTGCGLNQIWSGQFQQVSRSRRYFPTGGAGTLGFDIPAAIGASVGLGKAKGVCVMGDFGFTFMVEELAVAAKYQLPIVVIILNNANLSLIRQNQKYAYGYEYAVEMRENKEMIDYVMVSKGLGCLSERVTEEQELIPALTRAKASDRPYVIEILVQDETDCDMGNSIDAIKRFN